MTTRRTLSILGAAALLGLTAAPATGATSDDAAVVVADCDGVTVIVDLTDLGGAVESGCAEGDPASGREALEAAGFTPANDPSGFICTINDQPDPCPEEFEGVYWAYWQVVDGEWTVSQVGADDADPGPGDVEGWRYNDGSVPPPLPAVDAETTDGETAETETTETETTANGSSEAEATTDEDTAADASADASDEESENGGVSPALWVAIGVVVLALVAGLLIRRSRASGS